MIKRFSNYHMALDAGDKIGKRLSCNMYVMVVYNANRTGLAAAILASSSSAHLMPSDCARWNPLSGWYFRGTGYFADSEEGKRLLSLPESEPLPGKQESNYGLAAAYTQGYTPEQLRKIARGMEEHGTCVWHEAARVSGRLELCPCCGCCPESRNFGH